LTTGKNNGQNSWKWLSLCTIIRHIQVPGHCFSRQITDKTQGWDLKGGRRGSMREQRKIHQKDKGNTRGSESGTREGAGRDKEICK